jgi:hypothetical protein
MMLLYIFNQVRKNKEIFMIVKYALLSFIAIQAVCSFAGREKELHNKANQSWKNKKVAHKLNQQVQRQNRLQLNKYTKRLLIREQEASLNGIATDSGMQSAALLNALRVALCNNR